MEVTVVRTYGIFYEEILQAVLLYGLETRVLNDPILNNIEVGNIGFVIWISWIHLSIVYQGRCIYPQ